MPPEYSAIVRVTFLDISCPSLYLFFAPERIEHNFEAHLAAQSVFIFLRQIRHTHEVPHFHQKRLNIFFFVPLRHGGEVNSVIFFTTIKDIFRRVQHKFPSQTTQNCN